MTMCWNCGRKITGTPIRSWETTSYSQRSFASVGLRSGRIRVGGSGGQRQTLVSLCIPCCNTIHPPRLKLSDIPDFLGNFLADLNFQDKNIRRARAAVKATCFLGIIACFLAFIAVAARAADMPPPASLVACVAGQPKCEPVRTYPSWEACRAALEYLDGSELTREFPLHCETAS